MRLAQRVFQSTYKSASVRIDSDGKAQLILTRHDGSEDISPVDVHDPARLAEILNERLGNSESAVRT